jgi:hypothetical protein
MAMSLGSLSKSMAMSLGSLSLVLITPSVEFTPSLSGG